MKSIFIHLFTYLFIFILIFSFAFGIIYLASIGRQTLLYVVKTPYGDNIIKVAEFDTNICQTSLNNMIDKTNYRCEDSFKVTLKYLTGEYK